MAEDRTATQTATRPPVFIIPGANPSPRVPDFPRNLIIVPTDPDQRTIRLNAEFQQKIDLSDLRSQASWVTPHSDFELFHRDKRSPVAFIVTAGGAEKIADRLATLLMSSSLASLGPELERVWLPLLGMEASSLYYDQSLEAILNAIASAASEWSRTRPTMSWRFIVATSNNIDRDVLVQLRHLVETWSGREPTDLHGALANLHVEPDPEALTVLEFTAKLSLAQRPPLDNGGVGTRSLLFALGGSWRQSRTEMQSVRSAFAATLAALAGERLRQAQDFYFLEDAIDVRSATAPAPVRFDDDLRAILQTAAGANPNAPVGVGPIALALLDRCERSDPRPTHARRALDRMGVSPDRLKQAFEEALTQIPEPGRPPESPSPAPPAPTREIAIPLALLGNDNPDQNNLDDKLGVEAEAQAFARVAAARDVNPPLAFGIFGDWGSGKSFFMRLMQQYVDRLQAPERSAKRAPEAASGLFHRNIVQIRFNAWHYAETELWASLVDNIFTELDRWVLARTQPQKRNALFDNLATARELTLESAERLLRRREEQRVATQRLADAERNLAAARETAGATPRAFWDAVCAAFYKTVSRADVEAAAATLGLDHLSDDAEALKHSFDALKDDTLRGSVAAKSLLRRLLGAPSLILLAVLVLILPTALFGLRNWLRSWPSLHDAVNGIHELVLSAAGVLASAAAVVGLAGGKVRAAVRKLEKFRAAMDDAVEGQLKKPTDGVKAAEKALAKLRADITEAQSVLAASIERVAEAAREYETGTGRGRLLRFVRDRVANGDYARHLGLIATIRKDFTQLSDLMVDQADTSVREEAERQSKAYGRRVRALIRADLAKKLMTHDEKMTLLRSTAAPEAVRSDNSEPIFSRIILYIDDLDRCPPRKVVDVLQAVHLLLTFPLFIVVVAVDVRWVSRSLEAHYTELIGGAESASANDYLEKIFQVPYWVRAMTPLDSQRLLEGLATAARRSPGSVVAGAGRSGPVPRAPESQVTRASPGAPGIRETERQMETASAASTRPATAADHSSAPKPDPPSAEREGARDRREADRQNEGERSTESVGEKADETTRAIIAARALELTPGERAFMRELAPFAASTPRRVLRFLNVYRVIKASLGVKELDQLEGEAGYRALMTQLAIAVEAPALHRHWLSALRATPRDGNAQEVQSRVKAALLQAGWGLSQPEQSRLADALNLFWTPALSEEAHSPEVAVQAKGREVLEAYGDLARRYSFSD